MSLVGFRGGAPERVWAAAQKFLNNVVSEQAAKRPTIETGLIHKAGIQTDPDAHEQEALHEERE